MAQYTHAYISSVDFLQQREILNKALDIKEVDWNFMDFMELFDREEVTAQPTYTSYVNEDVYALGVVSGTPSPAASVTLTLTDAAASTVAVGSLCFDHANPAKQGLVKAISGDDLTVVSTDGSNLTFTDTKSVSFYSTAAGEGSGSIIGKRYKLTPYTNQVQIFKNSVRMTDIQKTSRIEVDYNGKPYYMFKAQHDALMKFRSDIAFGLMYNQKAGAFTGGSLTDANGNQIQITGGLDEYVTDRGIDQSLTAGAIDIDEFRDLTKQLDLRRAPSDYLVLCSSAKNIALDDLFNAMDATPDLTNARFSVDGQNINLGVDSWKIYNRTYSKKWLPMMDAANVTNFTDAPTAIDAAYFLPMGGIKVDASGEQVDRFRMRYMEGDGTNLKYKEILTGGLAPTPTNNEMYLDIAYSATIGLEILGAEHFAKMN